MSNTVCITGTTRGIGLEFVKQYAEVGWKVFACSRHPKATALQRLKSMYSNVSILKLDVCEQSQIEKLAIGLQDIPIDLLINSAGIYGSDEYKQNFENVRFEEMQGVFMTNSLAPLVISRTLLPNLVSGELKTIVTLTSRMGSISDNTSGGSYAYRVSKAAINMVMKNLAIDLQSKKIKVILLHPGWVKTDLGGPEALIGVTDSVKGMRTVIDKKLKEEAINTEHLFFNYRGEIVPW